MNNTAADRASDSRVEIKLITEPAEATVLRFAEIETVCFGENAWSERGIAGFLSHQSSHMLAAICGGDIIGYVCAFIICDEAEITNLAVLPQYRREGIGRSLMLELEAYSRTLGASAMLLEVRTQNVPAVALYKSLGFAAAGLRRNYYDNPRDDALIMKKINIGTDRINENSGT